MAGKGKRGSARKGAPSKTKTHKMPNGMMMSNKEMKAEKREMKKGMK